MQLRLIVLQAVCFIYSQVRPIDSTKYTPVFQNDLERGDEHIKLQLLGVANIKLMIAYNLTTRIIAHIEKYVHLRRPH